MRRSNQSYATPRTSVYSEMLANDPQLAAKMAQAKQDAKALANTAVTFYASAPLVCGTTPITGFTPHGINSVISHAGGGVPPKIIMQTVRNPVQVILQSNGNFRITGKYAVVMLNQAGKVVTVWPKVGSF